MCGISGIISLDATNPAITYDQRVLFDYINLKHKTINNTKDSKSNNLIINQQNTFSQWIKIAQNKVVIKTHP